MYEGIVSRLANFRPIPNADRIQQADCMVGSVVVASVITGKDAVHGSLGIYFGPDIQLSEEYCKANDLLAIYDDTGKKIGGGYFDEKRRVRAQRMKGVKSEGLWMPVSSLALLDVYQTYDPIRFNEGDKITEYNGIQVCKRYPKPEPKVQGNKQGATKRTILEYFPEHVDTDQLMHNLKEVARIPAGARVIITEKLHGTSHRVGNVKVPVELPFYKRAANWLLKAFTGFWEAEDWFKSTEYKITHGTRRVVLQSFDGGYYGDQSFRLTTVGNPSLERDMMLYGELVGYVGSRPIMERHSTKEFKELKKKYGEEITYDYGLEEGQCKFYLYRASKFNGFKEQDLTFNELLLLSDDLGYSVVPILYVGAYDGNVDTVVELARSYAEQNNGMYAESRLGDHISEGVCVRFEHEDRVWVYKYKSYAFKVMEGILAPSMEDES